MSTFDRYTDPAKRAIFFARAITLMSSERNKITSLDMLGGVLYDESVRAETIFHLVERFPVHSFRPWKLAELPKDQGPPLTDSCKMILAWAHREAGQMGDYWIDTEHLLLGILRVRECPAARLLERTGLTLKTARKTVLANKPSRPDYGPVPRWWRIKNRLFRMALLGQTP